MSHNIVLQLFFSLINGGNVTEMRSIQTRGNRNFCPFRFFQSSNRGFQPVNEDLIRQLVLGFIILKISDKIHDSQLLAANGSYNQVFLSCLDPALWATLQTWAPQSSYILSSLPEYTTPVCNSERLWYLSVKCLNGGGTVSSISLVSATLRDGLGDLTGLMIFRIVAEDEDNSLCRVAMAEPAMETWPTQRGRATPSSRTYCWVFSEMCVKPQHRGAMAR